MACPFCGYKEAVAAPAQQQQAYGSAPMQPAYGAPAPMAAPTGAIRDIPLEQGLAMAARGAGAAVTSIKCKDCGATVNVGQGERTTACAFCGSKQVLAE